MQLDPVNGSAANGCGIGGTHFRPAGILPLRLNASSYGDDSKSKNVERFEIYRLVPIWPIFQQKTRPCVELKSLTY